MNSKEYENQLRFEIMQVYAGRITPGMEACIRGAAAVFEAQELELWREVFRREQAKDKAEEFDRQAYEAIMGATEHYPIPAGLQSGAAALESLRVPYTDEGIDMIVEYVFDHGLRGLSAEKIVTYAKASKTADVKLSDKCCGGTADRATCPYHKPA